ncbi:MAG: LamG-like jellyroll fold domain-containing protein [Verrucomicrobiota bacterium]
MKHNCQSMLRLGSVLLLALSSAYSVRADYQSTVLSQNPLGYWRLNETVVPTDNVLLNQGTLGASLVGSYIAYPPPGLTGPFTGSPAVGLDGISQYVTTPWANGVNTTSFSFEVWANPAQVPFTGNVAYLASDAVLSSPRSGWYMAQDNGSTFGAGSAFVVRMFNQNGTTPTVQLAAPCTNALGSWYHIVLTYDGTTATLYENGVAVTNAACAYVPNVSGPFNVGVRSDGSYFWPGKAAEVALYTNALSAGRVAAHYTAGASAPSTYATTVEADSPLIYYHFSGAPDPTATDLGSLGSAADGLYIYDAVPGVAGPKPPGYPGFGTTNTAVSFDDGGGVVVIPPLNLNTNTVTISGWVNIPGVQNLGAGLVVCDGGTTDSGLTMDDVDGGQGLGYVWNDDPNTYNVSLSGDLGLPLLNAGEWDFVALVIQPTEADVYISSPTIPFTSVTNYYTHVNQAFDASTLFGADLTNGIDGSLDEVAIWGRSLSAGELYTEYASAVGSEPPMIFVNLEAPTNTVYVGDTLALGVNAGGTPDLHYQWYDTAGMITGATNTFYDKIDVQLSDSSSYHVVITNLYGSVTSSIVAITVSSPNPPAIVTPPVGENLYPGGTLNLSVVASGGGLAYQWYFGGVPITNANSANFQIPDVATTNSGSYSVLVTNILGRITGGPVTVNVFAPSNAYETDIVNDAPEAWYRFEETGATNMYDSMGRHDGYYTNLTGTPVTLGGAGPVVAGNGDKSVSFTGGSSTSYGLAPFSPLLNREDFAIEAWVNTSDTADANITAVSSDSALQGYGIWTYPAGTWSGEIAIGGTQYYIPANTAAATIVPGQWAHVVISFGTNDALVIYVNGTWDGSLWADFQRNSSSPFIIGAMGPEPVTHLFDGEVAEVAVYTHSLSLAQAQKHYSDAVFPNPVPPYFVNEPESFEVMSNSANSVTFNGLANGPLPINYQWYDNGVPIVGATNTSLTVSETTSNAGAYVLEASNGYGSTNSPAATLSIIPGNPSYVNVTNGLVLHLTFDGNYLDSSGHGNNGTAAGVSNALPTIVAGRIGSGAVSYATITDTGLPVGYDGPATVLSSSFVTLGNPPDLQFGSSTDFSVSYWVKLPVGYTNGDLPFFCSAVGSTTANGITLAPGYATGGFGFSYNSVSFASANNLINDGNWHHLLHTVSRTGYAYTYLDGNLADSLLATGIGDLDTAGPFNIGQDPTGVYPEAGSAIVDDLAVWNRALTAYEAYSVYYAATNSNASFDTPGKVKLNVSQVGKSLILSWQPGATLGTLMQADSLNGPWTPVGVYTPQYEVPPTSGMKFYRLSLSE